MSMLKNYLLYKIRQSVLHFFQIGHNESEKRINVVAKFVRKHKQLKVDDLFVATKELGKVNGDKINKNITKVRKIIFHALLTLLE